MDRGAGGLQSIGLQRVDTTEATWHAQAYNAFIFGSAVTFLYSRISFKMEIITLLNISFKNFNKL